MDVAKWLALTSLNAHAKTEIEGLNIRVSIDEKNGKLNHTVEIIKRIEIGSVTFVKGKGKLTCSHGAVLRLTGTALKLELNKIGFLKFTCHLDAGACGPALNRDTKRVGEEIGNFDTGFELP